MDDELLVLRCQEGDATALDELLSRWQQRLWKRAVRLTDDAEGAWDILQETCLVIARDIRKLETASAFPLWAYRIVTHKSRDWLRRHTRRRQRETLFAARSRPDPEEAQEVHEKLENLREARRRLTDADRILLTLRFEEGFSIEEIAEISDVPAGTVKSRLHYAKQRLRTLMEKNHERE